MSAVTNLLIAFSSGEDEEKIQQQLRQHINNGRPFNVVSVDAPALPRGWYAGSKFMEAGLFIGAYNHLDLEALITFMESMTWHEPEDVQLIVKEQWDSRFRLFDLFPEG